MIKRIVSFCCVVFLFGTAVDAAEIKVRTAEHDGFTRIVLDYGSTPTPKIEPKDGGIRVSFDVDVKFDLDTFFNRLSKNRLQPPKVSARNNQIEFNFDCDCGFEQFTEQGNLLVLDISEAAFKPHVEKNVAPIVQTPTVDLPIQIQEPVTKPEKFAEIKSAESIVENQLRKALEQSLAKSILDRNPSPKFTEIKQEVLDEHLSILKTDGSGSFASKTTKPQTSDGTKCIPDKDLNFETWGDSNSNFFLQLTSKRDALVSDLGLLNEDAEGELVRLYVYFGFAEEALAILAKQPDDFELERELAKVMKGASQNRSGYFADMYSCPSKVSIWGVLSSGTDLNKKMLDESALQMAMIALPKPMLDILGPRLVDILVELEMNETAQTVLNHVEARSPKLKQILAVTKSKIDVQNGNIDVATHQLEQLIDSASSVSPDAMTSLIDLKLQADTQLPKRTADIAEALAWENKGTSLHTTLLQSETLARALQGDFDAAQAKYAQAPKTPEFVDDFAKLVVKKASDASFLKFVLGSDLSISPKSNTQHKISQRLEQMGFSEEARSFADVTTRSNTTADVSEVATVLKDPELPNIHQIAQDDLLKTARSIIETSSTARQDFQMRLANSIDTP